MRSGHRLKIAGVARPDRAAAHASLVQPLGALLRAGLPARNRLTGPSARDVGSRCEVGDGHLDGDRPEQSTDHRGELVGQLRKSGSEPRHEGELHRFGADADPYTKDATAARQVRRNGAERPAVEPDDIPVGQHSGGDLSGPDGWAGDGRTGGGHR